MPVRHPFARIGALFASVMVCAAILTAQEIWIDRSSGTAQTLNGVYFAAANTATAVGGNGTILRTTDDGMTWTSQTSGTTSNLNSVWMLSATTGLVVGDGGLILRTTNGGTSWTTIASGTTQNLHSVQFPDGTFGFAVGDSGKVLFTNNSGVNWYTQTSGTTASLNTVFFLDSNHGFFAGGGGAMGETTDRGTTWFPRSNAGFNDVYSISMNGTKGIAGLNYGKILLGTSSGSGWNYSSIGTSANLKAVTFLNADTAVIVDDAGEIYRSSNAGDNWTKEISQGATGLNGVTLRDSSGIIVGGNGTIKTIWQGTVSSFSLTAGNGQSGAVNTILDSSLTVTVKDALGNAVPAGITVSFSVTGTPGAGSGAAVFPTSTTTDANGKASTRFLLGSIAGTYQITASVGGASSSAFSVTATAWSDPRGPNYSLAGSQSDVEIADNAALDLTTTYTIEAWVRPLSFNSLGGIVSKWHTTGNSYFLRLSSTSPYTGIAFDGLETANGVLTAGTWYHIAAVNDNGSRTLYVNGEPVSITGSAVTVQANTDPVTIGLDFKSDPRYFSGLIDEVRIWNTARSQAEIKAAMHTELTGTETGLAGYWKLNEGTGTTTVDGTPNGNNGTLNTASWAAADEQLYDGQNYGVSLDGTNTITVNDDNALDLTTNYTIEAWIKPSSFNTLAGIVSKYQTPSANGYFLRLTASSPYTGIGFDGLESANGVLTAGQWYHIAAVNDGGTRHLYINGTETALSGSVISVANNSDPLTIGADYLAAPRYFNGAIDEVRIWNTVRPVDSIQADMNHQLTGSETGLTGLWQFNEGFLTSAFDASSNANNGTLKKSSWILSTAPLPVELTAFTATTGRQGVELRWTTATEVNCAGFEIEEKALSAFTIHGARQNGADLQRSWTRIGSVEGNGTTNSAHDYYFSDERVRKGTYQFRLKQTDRDGKFKYSKTVELTLGGAPLTFALSQNYPNPFNPATTLAFTIPQDGLTSLKIYNTLGQEVATLVNEELKAGEYHEATFNATALASGFYIARLQSGTQVQLKKMMLLK